VNRGGDAELCRQISSYARYGDLMVLGQREEGAANLVPMELPEEVMTHSGRPILVMPYAGDFPTVGRRPIIAWSGSRRSARALADALPLIRGCESATLVSMDSDHNDAEAACQEVSTYLATHGIAVRTELLASDDIGIMDLLLNTVTDHGADLLVMGGRQQATLPFGSKGAGTRHILQQMTVPVLMSCG
jgi:nucleotide-binding universal stress UspA family protein